MKKCANCRFYQPRDGYCTLRDCETGWNRCCSDFEEA